MQYSRVLNQNVLGNKVEARSRLADWHKLSIRIERQVPSSAQRLINLEPYGLPKFHLGSTIYNTSVSLDLETSRVGQMYTSHNTASLACKSELVEKKAGLIET